MTGDPRQGGIFWSEEKARGRQAQYHNQLAYERNETALVRNRETELRGQVNSVQQQNAALRNQISDLRSNLNGMKTQNIALKEQISDVQRSLAGMENRSAALETDSSMPEATKQSELNKLKVEIAQKRSQVAELSDLISR